MSLISSSNNGYAAGAGFSASKVVPLAAVKSADATDVQMDQIRDLLFGEFKREIDTRLAAIESKLVDFERRLSAARTEDEGRRKALLDDLARGVEALGQHVKQIVR